MQKENEIKDFDFFKTPEPKPKKTSFWKKLLGANPKNQIQQEVKFVKRFHEVIFVHPYEKLIEKDKKGVRHDFETYIFEQGISEEHLEKKHKEFSLAKNIYIGIFLMFVGFFLYFSIEGSKLTAFTFLTWSTVFAINAMANGLRAHQITIRNFCSVREYVVSVSKFLFNKGE